MEREMKEMKERVGVLESEVNVLRTEKDVWKNAYNDLHSQIILSEKKAKDTEVEVKEIKETQKVWKEEQEKENISFKRIVEQQVKAKDEEITEKVIKVIKEKPDMVRDTVERKKSVVVVGIKEEFTPNRRTREGKDKEEVEHVIEAIQEEDNKIVGEIEEVFRLGKYKEGVQRPIKIRFRSQVAAEEVVGRAWKLSKTENYKKVWVRKDRTMEERNTIKDLKAQANEKNETRTEEEKKKFFWRVIDMELRKWYVKVEETE